MAVIGHGDGVGGNGQQRIVLAGCRAKRQHPDARAVGVTAHTGGRRNGDTANRHARNVDGLDHHGKVDLHLRSRYFTDRNDLLRSLGYVDRHPGNVNVSVLDGRHKSDAVLVGDNLAPHLAVILLVGGRVIFDDADTGRCRQGRTGGGEGQHDLIAVGSAVCTDRTIDIGKVRRGFLPAGIGHAAHGDLRTGIGIVFVAKEYVAGCIPTGDRLIKGNQHIHRIPGIGILHLRRNDLGHQFHVLGRHFHAVISLHRRQDLAALALKGKLIHLAVQCRAAILRDQIDDAHHGIARQTVFPFIIMIGMRRIGAAGIGQGIGVGVIVLKCSC